MDEIWKYILPATIAFVTTLCTLGIGYLQWRKQQKNSLYGEYVKEKQTAYIKLWEFLSEFKFKTFQFEITEKDFKKFCFEFGAYNSSNQLFIDHEDIMLAVLYSKALYKLNKLSVKISGKLPTSEPERACVSKDVNEIEDELIKRFRKILGSDLFETRQGRDYIKVFEKLDKYTDLI